MARHMFCPECDSGAVEPDEENGPHAYWCDECGHCFTKRPRKKTPYVSPEAKAKQAFTDQAAALGLDPASVGCVIEYQGRSFELVGLNTRAPKMPILLREKNTDNTMRATVEWLCARLKHPYSGTKLSVADGAGEELAKRGAKYGLDLSLIGRIFTINGHRVQFLGLIPRARSKPVSLQRLDDRTFRKCSIDVFRRISATMEPLVAAELPTTMTMTLPPPQPPTPAPVPKPAPVPRVTVSQKQPDEQPRTGIKGGEQLSLFG